MSETCVEETAQRIIHLTFTKSAMASYIIPDFLRCLDALFPVGVGFADSCQLRRRVEFIVACDNRGQRASSSAVHPNLSQQRIRSRPAHHSSSQPLASIQTHEGFDANSDLVLSSACHCDGKQQRAHPGCGFSCYVRNRSCDRIFGERFYQRPISCQVSDGYFYGGESSRIYYWIRNSGAVHSHCHFQ